MGINLKFIWFYKHLRRVLISFFETVKQKAAPTGNIDVPKLASVHEMYGGKIDMDAPEVEANVFRTMTCPKNQNHVKDVYNKIKTCPESEKELIPNIMFIIKLLLRNPAMSCSPERSFFFSKKT